MGNKLFGVDIARIVRQNTTELLDATLTKVTSGVRDAANPTGGTAQTTVDYPCKGIVTTRARGFTSGGIWRDDREQILLIGDSISGGTVAPDPGDRVTIEGVVFIIPEGATINADPAKATYTFEVARY